MKIDLIVRGIAVFGLNSRRQRQHHGPQHRRSILEHSRIIYFERVPSEIFVGSADWMRGISGRIEVVFPIVDGNLREQILKELLAISMTDNVKARLLQADGSYVPPLKRGPTPPEARWNSSPLRRASGATKSRQAKPYQGQAGPRPFGKKPAR